MKLRNKPFERAVRSRIRTALKSSPQLRKEYRQIRKMRRQNLHTRPWMSRLFFLFIVGFTLIVRKHSVEELIALIMLWHLGSIFLRVSFLSGGLYFSPALGVFNCLPIPDADIFKVQWRTFLRGSLWSAVDFSVLYYALGSETGGGIYSLAAGVAFGIIQWFFVVAFSVCLLVFRVRRFYYYLPLFFMVSAFGLLYFLPHKQVIAGWIARFAYWVPPVGWLVHAMGITRSQGALFDLLPCVLSALLLALFPMACSRIRRGYSLNETIFAHASRMGANPGTGFPVYPEVVDEFTEPASEVAARIHDGELRAGLDWDRLGLVERFASRFLSERERAITDYLLAGNPRWTSGLRSLAIVLFLLVVGSRLFAALSGSIAGVMVLIWVFLFLGIFAGKWRGFASPQGGGLQQPFYALYPLDIWELMRLLLKIYLLRFLFYLPLLLVAGFLLFGKFSPGPGIAGLTVVKFLIVAFSAHPIMAIAQISPGTNDGQKARVVFAALGLSIVCIASLITIIVSLTLTTVLLAGLVLAVTSCGTLLLYGRAYNNNRFDIVPARLQTGSPH